MKKVILIYPRLQDTIEEKAFLPLSLLCIAAPLKDINVKIIDQRVDQDWEKELLDSLNEDVVCVGINSMTGPQLKPAIDISKTVKKKINVPVVWGGVHASLLPRQTLENEFVDIVVIDEGDLTFHELVNCLINNKNLASVRGIGYKQNNSIIFTDQRELLDMDSLFPVPYSLVKDIDRYIGIKNEELYKRSLPLQTSRGCPYRCVFCYNAAFNKKRWRAKDSAKVIAEINEIVEKYKINGLFLLDDNFFVDFKRAKEIFRGIKKLPVELYNLTVRADTFSRFDDELIGLMDEIGVKSIYIGVESGSEEILKKLNKDITLDEVFISNQKIKKTKIKPVYSFMVGFPFEKESDRRKTLKLIYLLKKQNKSALFGFNILNPYPSNIMQDCIKRGFNYPEKTEDWASDLSNVQLPWISCRQMKKFRRIAFSISLLYDPSDFKNPGKKLFANFLLTLSLFRIKFNFFSLYFEDKLFSLYRRLKGKNLSENEQNSL